MHSITALLRQSVYSRLAGYEDIGQAPKGPVERIAYLDLARGLAIFFMIITHAMMTYEHDYGGKTLLGLTVILLGTAPAAPVFMLLMGVFFMRSRRNSLKSGVIRGLQIFALGYILNVFRYCIPVLIDGELTGAHVSSNSYWHLFLMVDILQMAGLSLIIMSILRRYVPNRLIWLVLALGIGTVSPLLWGRWEHVPGIGLLWGEKGWIYFPLFPWLIYPLVGMCTSTWLVEPGRITKKRMLILGLALCILGLLMMLPSLGAFVIGDYYHSGINVHSLGAFVLSDYYHSGINVHLIMMGFIALWLALLRLITEKIPDNIIFKLLKFWSRHVLVIYCIHWVLIGWGILIIGANNQNDTTALVAGFVFLIPSDLLTRLYVR